MTLFAEKPIPLFLWHLANFCLDFQQSITRG
jgi:hypothetical protein